MSSPTRLGISCSLIIVSDVSNLFIVRGDVLVKMKDFLELLLYSKHKRFGGRFQQFLLIFGFAHSVET